MRCIQRVVRRHLAKAKRDITEDELDQIIARAAVCIQRTVRRHLSARANLSRRFRASDTVPSVPDPAVELPDSASFKVPSGDPEQWAPEDSDDAASKFGCLHNLGHHQLAAWLALWPVVDTPAPHFAPHRLALSAYSDCSHL